MRLAVVAAASLLALIAPHASAATQTAFGTEGDPSKVARTITIGMTDDMRFSPATIDVKLGETVRFVVVNKGAMAHELVLGTKEEIDRHAQAMKRMAAGGPHDHHHMRAAPSMAHVDAGKSGEIVWRFNRAGSFEYACLVPGHYEAGMKGSISVK